MVHRLFFNVIDNKNPIWIKEPEVSSFGETSGFFVTLSQKVGRLMKS